MRVGLLLIVILGVVAFAGYGLYTRFQAEHPGSTIHWPDSPAEWVYVEYAVVLVSISVMTLVMWRLTR